MLINSFQMRMLYMFDCLYKLDNLFVGILYMSYIDLNSKKSSIVCNWFDLDNFDSLQDMLNNYCY